MVNSLLSQGTCTASASTSRGAPRFFIGQSVMGVHFDFRDFDLEGFVWWRCESRSF